MTSAVLLIPLLAVFWSARADLPGQITTGAVIHFGEDPTTQYAKENYDGVQGLRYFATSGANQLPGLQQPLLVYPGSVLGNGPIIIPTQVGIQNVAGGNKGIPYYGYFVSSTPSPQTPATLPPPPLPLPPPPPPPPPLPPPISPPPLHTNVDLTYDSLSSSSSLNGASYSPPTYTTPVPSPAPQPMLTSPPPVQATTYGPAKPVVLRPYLTTKHRGTFVLGPPHHHLTATKALIGHYHHLIPVSPKHIHTGPPPIVLIKSKPHPYPVIYAAHNPQTHKTPLPPTLYGPPTRRPQISQSNALSHPDITKAIFHPQPQDSYAAAAALSSATNPPAAYSFGTTAALPQQYYVPLIPYTSVLGPQHRSDETGALRNSGDVAQEGTSKDTVVGQEHYPDGEFDEQLSPVLFYKGVRPPMRLYQEPQTSLIPAPSKLAELEKEAVVTGNILSPVSHSAGSSSSWMPINAPEGAVPARAYEIPAPDLSRGNSYYADEESEERGQMMMDYSHGQGGKVSAVPVSHGGRFPTQTDSDTHQRDIYKGNSEEVVSAVVLVKQK
ncbi:WAS/WASL-interacting protein family member 3-like isoform X2 [Zootermopsis nevadensis]|uniref:WAS/WASL-interacting protein family member 3-like isoform X2 n=1 Tax=Zootermopsis nevadensis TaxID=136037 RepID=UPI000B8E3E15|nr:WAS/WASL-interacting protein family member 3-like isoform X2 [Zootermopsis nevadensis]